MHQSVSEDYLCLEWSDEYMEKCLTLKELVSKFCTHSFLASLMEERIHHLFLVGCCVFCF